MSSNEKDLLDNDEINKAAKQFETNLKIIKNRTRTLPKKSMERILNAVVEFPLGDNDPSFRTAIEHEVFVLTLAALSAKNQMITAVYMNQAEKQKELEEANVIVNEGDNNGET